jgi:hypothetical protein
MVYRVLKYLEGSTHLGLWYKPVVTSIGLTGFAGAFDKSALLRSLCVFSDSSWADNYADATSNSGMAMMFLDCLVMWRSVKQRVVARSTMESEYIALSTCVNEIRWAQNIAKFLLGFECESTPTIVSGDHDALRNIAEAVTLYGDNQASICVGNATAATRRSRHINVKFHNVKHAVVDGLIKLEYVNTKKNVADFFTKCLGANIFFGFRELCMGATKDSMSRGVMNSDE